MPLGHGLMLAGTFHMPSATYQIGARSVAVLNGRAMMYARQMFSPLEEFAWYRKDGEIGNRAVDFRRVGVSDDAGDR